MDGSRGRFDRDRCSRRMDLNLTIRDLGNWWSGWVYLNLAVGDLGDGCSGGVDLDLTIADLGDWCS